MNETIEEYFNKNSEQIRKRFKEALIDELRIGNIVNNELGEFINKLNTAQYTVDYFVKLRSDFCIKLLEQYLAADETEFKTFFKTLHRGTPYYFIALGRLLDKDFEGFGYYMDMAVVQDNKNMYFEHRPDGSAAEKTFLGFKDYPPQFEIDNIINKYIFDQIAKTFDIYKKNSPESSYKISDFKNKFVINNLRDKDNPYHSIVSSFYSWIHECQYLVWLLHISPPEQGHNGSMEPYYLHLAKGALILESIGKMVIHKKTGIVFNRTLWKILNEDLNNDLFGVQTEINQDFENSKIKTLDDILKYVAKHSSFDKVYIYKIALTIRNTTSHSLNWNAATDFAKTQKYLYFIMAKALFSMIELIP